MIDGGFFFGMFVCFVFGFWFLNGGASSYAMQWRVG